jgi:ferritin
MLNKRIEQAINEQINFEIYSAYIYLSMSSWFVSKGLNGMANWMEVQAQEEMTHAQKFYKYVMERGGRVLYTTVKGPETEWKSPLNAFEDALNHEMEVTRRINNIVTVALEEKDYATQSFLQWFVDEQVEEEASVSEIMDQLNLTEGHPNGLFMIDRELAQRTFVNTATAPKA